MQRDLCHLPLSHMPNIWSVLLVSNIFYIAHHFDVMNRVRPIFDRLLQNVQFFSSQCVRDVLWYISPAQSILPQPSGRRAFSNQFIFLKCYVSISTLWFDLLSILAHIYQIYSNMNVNNFVFHHFSYYIIRHIVE